MRLVSGRRSVLRAAWGRSGGRIAGLLSVALPRIRLRGRGIARAGRGSVSSRRLIGPLSRLRRLLRPGPLPRGALRSIA